MVWSLEKLQTLCEVFTDGDWIESKHQSTEGVRLIQTGNVGVGKFKNRIDKARFISIDTLSLAGISIFSYQVLYPSFLTLRLYSSGDISESTQGDSVQLYSKLFPVLLL